MKHKNVQYLHKNEITSSPTFHLIASQQYFQTWKRNSRHVKKLILFINCLHKIQSIFFVSHAMKAMKQEYFQLK